MIKAYSEFTFPSCNQFSKEEEDFKLQMRLQLGACVRQTLLLPGAMGQFHLYIWVDSADNGVACPSARALCEKEALIVDTYLKSFHLEKEVYKDVALNLYGFREALISYAYGHSIRKLREMLTESAWGIRRVLLDHVTVTYYLDCERKLTAEEIAVLKSLCLDVMKEHDRYQVLSLSDIRVKEISSEERFSKK